MLKLNGISVVLLLLLSLPGSLKAQRHDYDQIFSDDWLNAEAFERENRQWMEPLLEKNNIPWRVAIPVIFPELVRYSALRDKMETTLLKALYVNLGDEYANFSIGRFQIKPSFASTIRAEAPKALGRRSGIILRQPEEFDDISSYRKSIVADLQDPRTEFRYVIAFIKLCEKKYKTGKMNEEEKIIFLSTAYNYGVDKSREQIERMAERKFFSTRLMKPATTYCYSDISLFRYRQITGHLHGQGE